MPFSETILPTKLAFLRTSKIFNITASAKNFYNHKLDAVRDAESNTTNVSPKSQSKQKMTGNVCIAKDFTWIQFFLLMTF